MTYRPAWSARFWTVRCNHIDKLHTGAWSNPPGDRTQALLIVRQTCHLVIVLNLSDLNLFSPKSCGWFTSEEFIVVFCTFWCLWSPCFIQSKLFWTTGFNILAHVFRGARFTRGHFLFNLYVGVDMIHFQDILWLMFLFWNTVLVPDNINAILSI